MNIALIADDKKKELMAAFCIAYKDILKEHILFATGTTGVIVNEATGLKIRKFSHGILGEQQMCARAAYNELDLVIFFRDSTTTISNEPDMSSILSVCDSNHIPFATNIATAEMIIKGLERGELDWRKNIKK